MLRLALLDPTNTGRHLGGTSNLSLSNSTLSTQKRSHRSRFSSLPMPRFGRSVSENSTWRGTL